jgi:predicted O-methyltransferase YrrM
MRTVVFEKVLKFLEQKPLKILEIGTSRDLNPSSHVGDGWSTIYWCEYIQKYGGKIITCDIEPEAIENCKKLTKKYTDSVDIEYYLGDGEELIDDSFNFFYLDGANDSRATYRQFKKINREQAYILVDDYRTTKTIMLEHLEYGYTIYKGGQSLMMFYQKEQE